MAAGWAQTEQKFTILSHYSYPPYQTASKQGLSFALAEYLSNESQQRYEFKVMIVPKRRLLSLITDKNWSGIVPWVIPEWFSDVDDAHLHWSSPILETSDLLISRLDHALEWNGPESLFGLRFGGILGHVYVELKDDINEKKIIREDGPDLRSNFLKLRARRIDALFADSRSIAYFQLTEPRLMDGLYVSKKARSNSKHQLKMMFNLNDAEANAWLKNTLQKMRYDKKWHAILKAYGSQ